MEDSPLILPRNLNPPKLYYNGGKIAANKIFGKLSTRVHDDPYCARERGKCFGPSNINTL